MRSSSSQKAGHFWVEGMIRLDTDTAKKGPSTTESLGVCAYIQYARRKTKMYCSSNVLKRQEKKCLFQIPSTMPAFAFEVRIYAYTCTYIHM
jgi:hypothetical protein